MAGSTAASRVEFQERGSRSDMFAIETSLLTRVFGPLRAVDDLNINVSDIGVLLAVLVGLIALTARLYPNIVR